MKTKLHAKVRPHTPEAPQVKPKKQKGTFSRVMKALFRYYPGMTTLTIIFLVINAIVSSVPAIFMENIYSVIEDAQTAAPAGPELWDAWGGEITGNMLVLIGMYVVSLIFGAIHAQLLAIITQGFLAKMREQMFDGMQDLPIRYFDTHNHGDIMSYYTNDIEATNELLQHSITQMLISVTSLTGTIAMMLVLSMRLFAIMVVLGAIVLLVVRITTKISSHSYRAQQKNAAAVNGYIEEMIAGQRDIKVFTHEKQVMADFEPINDALYSASTTATTATSVVGPILNNLSHMFYAITCAVGTLWLTGEGTGGILITFLQYIRTFADRVSQIADQFNSIMLALAGAERIFDVLDTPAEIDEGSVTLAREGRDFYWVKPDGTHVPLKGDVRFYNVDFSYDPDKPVLKNLSLYAKPGQKIAFVGSTGAGKTTITNLINRFYDIQGGHITYDGIDVRDIKKDDLRLSLGIVLQDTHLFTGSVMENIRYGRLDATDEDCIRAAKIANAHYFISHLPQGYNTMLYSDGANLSQGQRQLVAIARAAVSEAPVLILDEATSSVDTRTEKLIEKGLDGLMAGRTVFVIAHRLSTVRNANAILVLEQGRVIERGSHADLLEQHGKYYQLYTNMIELA